MKVFRITADRKRYQMIGDAPGFVETHLPMRAEAPLLKNWQRLRMLVDRPWKKRGDFLFFPLEFLVTSSTLTASFMQCIRSDVQTLPIELEEAQEDYCLWNTVNFVDALDLQKTIFRPPPFSSIPKQWFFRADRLTRPMLFREPRCPSIPLVVTGEGDPASDFFHAYHDRGMKGLTFELLWEDG